MKLERGCVDCGYNAHPAALEFDHRDPADKDPLLVGGRTISSQLQRRWEWVLAEVAKCDVRCANCHAVRTAVEQHHLHGRSDGTEPDAQPALWTD